MTAQAGMAGQLSWLLDNLVERVEHIRQAVVLSRDGLVVAAARTISPQDADRVSAVAAGVQSLARGAGQHFGVGEVRQTIIEMQHGFLFVASAGEGTCLAVFATADANVGVVAYEMAMQARRMGRYLAAPSRSGFHGSSGR